MPLGTEAGLGPGHIVLDENPATPPQKGAQPPNFQSMSIVAKLSPISATAEYLLLDVLLILAKIWLLWQRPLGPRNQKYLLRICRP